MTKNQRKNKLEKTIVIQKLLADKNFKIKTTEKEYKRLVRCIDYFFTSLLLQV